MMFILIDDDPIANLIHRKIVDITCKGKAEEIITFLSAGEALDFLAGCQRCDVNKDHVVLLDINMPGINGWEFLDRLESFPRPWTNIYILSSSVAQFDLTKAKNNRLVKGYLTKPLSVPSLKSILQDHLTD